MNTRRILPVFALAFLLAGCLAANYNNKPATEVAQNVSAEYDDFDRIVKLRAPWLHKGTGVSYQLRSSLDAVAGDAIYLAYVEYEFFISNRGGYGGSSFGSASEAAFKNFYTARDPAGNRFEVVEGPKSFDGCREVFCYYEEEFGIVIPEEYFEAVRGKEMRFRASSRAGVYIDIAFSPGYLEGVRLRVDEERGTKTR